MDNYHTILRLLETRPIEWNRIETLAGTDFPAYLRQAHADGVFDGTLVHHLSDAYRCHLLAEGRARTHPEHTEAAAQQPRPSLVDRILDAFYKAHE